MALTPKQAKTLRARIDVLLRAERAAVDAWFSRRTTLEQYQAKAAKARDAQAALDKYVASLIVDPEEETV